MLADPALFANPGPRDGIEHNGQLNTNEMTKKMFNVDESSERPSWPFTFSIYFVERRFDLAARTKVEMDEWMRVFKIIVTLNKIGFSVTEKNPYTFEA